MNTVIFEIKLGDKHGLQLVEGDITAEEVDAIVNAANSHLHHGGGVAWAISQRGGAIIQQESDAWVREQGTVSHESPAFTSAGKLPCRYVIHAVGPVWGEGDESSRLSAAVKGALWRADELGLASIALPAISTGIFGFPKELAARIIFEAVADYFSTRSNSGIRLVRVVLFDQPTLDAFQQAWQEWERGK